MTTMTTRTYRELLSISDYYDRLRYLMLFGNPGEDTFGNSRRHNQVFYKSTAWLHVRAHVIVRDTGCDLAHADYPIDGEIYVHHMNPLSVDTLKYNVQAALDPEGLICVSFKTHQTIHYAKTLPNEKFLVVRESGDTKLW